MSAGDLPCLSTMTLQDFLDLSVLVRELRLVRVPFDVSDPRPILQKPTCTPRDAAAGYLATRQHGS